MGAGRWGGDSGCGGGGGWGVCGAALRERMGVGKEGGEMGWGLFFVGWWFGVAFMWDDYLALCRDWMG